MESPVKKLDFNVADKENNPDVAAVEQIKPVVAEVKKVQESAPTSGLRPEEADEPLLQENPQRFVLFPIKYHEVSRCPIRLPC